MGNLTLTNAVIIRLTTKVRVHPSHYKTSLPSEKGALRYAAAVCDPNIPPVFEEQLFGGLGGVRFCQRDQFEEMPCQPPLGLRVDQDSPLAKPRGGLGGKTRPTPRRRPQGGGKPKKAPSPKHPPADMKFDHYDPRKFRRF